jgi:hypothetical protein
MHYIQSQAQAGSSEAEAGDGNEGELGYPPDQANEYRARFHKSLTEPSPFQQMPPPGAPQGSSIDPSLAAQAVRETSALRNQGPDGGNGGDKGQAGGNGE